MRGSGGSVLTYRSIVLFDKIQRHIGLWLKENAYSTSDPAPTLDRKSRDRDLNVRIWRINWSLFLILYMIVLIPWNVTDGWLIIPTYTHSSKYSRGHKLLKCTKFRYFPPNLPLRNMCFFAQSRESFSLGMRLCFTFWWVNSKHSIG